jgi:biopolymer transport protein ExbB
MNNRVKILQQTAAFLFVVGILFVTGPASGQDAAPNAAAPQAAAAPAATAPAVAEGPKTIFDLVLDIGSDPTGLVFLVVLALFSLAGTSVAIERFVNLRRGIVIPAAFTAELQVLVHDRDPEPETFINLCSKSNSPISSVLKAGILRIGRPLPEVEKSMEDAAAREMASIRARIKPLSTVGNIAPLVGLLGTVVGMILAFQTTSVSGTGKGQKLAEGIYMALFTTAAGLTIAIPALLLATFFYSKSEKFFREIDELMMDTFPCFAKMVRQSDEDSASVTTNETANASPQPALAATEG